MLINFGKIEKPLKNAAQQSVHPTLGSLARFQAFFYASAFSQSDGVPPPAPARVTQTVRQPRAKAKSSSNRKFGSAVEFGKSKSVGVFSIQRLILVFNQKVFMFSAFLLNRLSCFGMVSGWLGKVSKIGCFLRKAVA